MASPPRYERAKDFTEDTGATTDNADINAELDKVQQTLDALIDNAELIQRDDGELMNRSVSWDQLAEAVVMALAKPDFWETGVEYTAGKTVINGEAWYRANTTHTSGGTFAGDSANWDLLIDFAAWATAASTSAANAATSESNAAASATAAAASATAAAADANTASQAVGVAVRTETASAGQTAFTAPAYTPGAEMLLVFVNGALSRAYTETSTTTIAFSSAMAGGEKVVILRSKRLTTAATDSTNVVNSLGGPSGTVSHALGLWGGIKIDARHYGVSASNADNATQLIAMRDDLMSAPEKHYEIHLPEGVIKYSNNRWIRGLRRISLIGGNTNLQCTASGKSYYRDMRSLLCEEIHADYADGDYPGDAAGLGDWGYKIDTVAAGQSTVTCSTPAEAGNLSAGDIVQIHGWLRQVAGVPLNPLYFEYAKVISVDVGTGAVVLSRPLKHDYSADWQDFEHLPASHPGEYAGAARIMPCTKTYTKMKDLLHIEGITFDKNPSSTAGHVIDGALLISLKDVVFADTTSNAAISQAESIICQNVVWEARLEVDKQINLVHYKNCKFLQGIAAATGVEESIEENCDYYGDDLCSPVRRILNNANHVDTIGASSKIGLLGSNYETFGSRLWSVSRSRFLSNAAWAPFMEAQYTINAYKVPTITVDSVGSSGEILIDKTTGSDALAAYRDVLKGTRIHLADGTKVALVTDIVDYDATYIAIEHDGSFAPVTAEIYYFSLLDRLEDGGGNTFTGTNPPLRFSRNMAAEANAMGAGGMILRVPNRGVDYQTYPSRRYVLLGKIVRVKVRVDRAYSGPDGSPLLRIRGYPWGTGVLYVDLATLGEREVSLNGSALLGSDVFTSSNLGRFATEFYIEPYGGGSAGLSGTAAQLPIVHVEIEIASPETV